MNGVSGTRNSRAPAIRPTRDRSGSSPSCATAAESASPMRIARSGLRWPESRAGRRGSGAPWAANDRGDPGVVTLRYLVPIAPPSASTALVDMRLRCAARRSRAWRPRFRAAASVRRGALLMLLHRPAHHPAENLRRGQILFGGHQEEFVLQARIDPNVNVTSVISAAFSMKGNVCDTCNTTHFFLPRISITFALAGLHLKFRRKRISTYVLIAHGDVGIG